jgi:hypothetical protein
MDRASMQALCPTRGLVGGAPQSLPDCHDFTLITRPALVYIFKVLNHKRNPHGAQNRTARFDTRL